MELKRGTILLALASRRETGGFAMAAHDLGVSPERLRVACQELGIDSHQPPPLTEAKSEFMRSYFEQLMEECHGIVTTAAAVAGMTRQGLSDHLRRYGVDPSEYRK